MTPGKTALVTGAVGFTGRYICQALRAEGLHVFGLGNHPSDDPAMFDCDLRDGDATQQVVDKVRPDYVLHLAAISYVGAGDLSAFYSVNVVGTCNLLHALESCRPEKVLIASSANIYGQPADGRPIAEARAPAPVNHYAASKLAMEHMARTWFDRLPIILARPFNYTGPGQDARFLVPKIVNHFREGKKAIALGNLDISRDFSHVREVVDCYLGLLTSDLESEAVNICSGRSISLKEIVDLMAEIAGYPIQVEQDPALIRGNEIKQLVGSNEKLRTNIGKAPSGNMRRILEDMFLSSMSGE